MLIQRNLKQPSKKPCASFLEAQKCSSSTSSYFSSHCFHRITNSQILPCAFVADYCLAFLHIALDSKGSLLVDPINLFASTA